MGCFRARDCWRACSLGPGRDSRPYGAIPHVSCPRRSAAPRLIAGIQDEVPFAGIPRPLCAVHPVTAIRKYGSADALRTTTSSDKASAVRAKLHVDVGMGYFRAHDCRRACFSARRRDSEVTTHLSCTRRSAAPLWKAGNQGEVPSAGILQPPCSVHPVGAIRKYVSASALRKPTASERAFASRAERVVDFGIG